MITRDRDFAICIEHEEPGQGPSIERLVMEGTRSAFREAASLLDAGAVIPVRVLSPEAAPWLQSFLPGSLHLDRDGDDWHVCAEPSALAGRVWS